MRPTRPSTAARAHCRPSEHTIWRDDLWQVRAGWARMGIPFVGGLASRDHVRLEDAPLDALAALGPLLQLVREHLETVSDALAADGGAAFPTPSTAAGG